MSIEHQNESQSLLKNLYLFNFKNYEEAHFSFSAGIQSITGRNGIGKTNLLDAIHYLCMTRSAFYSNEQYNILQGEQHFVLRGEFSNGEGEITVGCQFEKGKRKILKLGKKEYDKISEHIGKFPCVMIAPDDSALIREGSEVRRKFFDNLICQVDTVYLENLIRYNYALKQRNYILKQYGESKQTPEPDFLAPYDAIIIQLSHKIAAVRQRFTQMLTPFFEELYANISGKQEKMTIEYATKVEDDFDSVYQNAFEHDVILQRTTQGIHQDRYTFYMGGKLLKRFGSQGQQKSFLIALKLAKAKLISQQAQKYPILLMDDIFDKLDESRIERLLKVIGAMDKHQIFLTDARSERSEVLLKKTKVPYQIINLEAD